VPCRWRLSRRARETLLDTFKEQAKAHRAVAPLAELRASLAELRHAKLKVGGDGRNRTMLSAFRASTGRNQPSSNQFIFGTSAWLRGLIKPSVDQGLAYIDYSQQEFAIAGVLSGDGALVDAYMSGDPYLAFGKQAGSIPADATKQTHGGQRELFKQCVLAVQYGMGAESLADPPVKDIKEEHYQGFGAPRQCEQSAKGVCGEGWQYRP
jgi:DNA polymerase I